MTSIAPGRQGFRREEKELIAQGPPCDFSFRRAQSVSDLEKERPRAYRVRQIPMRGASLKYLTRSVWLNNNNLSTISGLDKFLGNMLEQPAALGWIDLSFNNISDVPDELLNYPNLRILYFHGNCIQSLASVEKLCRLQRLYSVTFHGNPIESIPSYRSLIINILPHIHNLDFAPVLLAEKDAVPPSGACKKNPTARSRL